MEHCRMEQFRGDLERAGGGADGGGGGERGKRWRKVEERNDEETKGDVN